MKTVLVLAALVAFALAEVDYSHVQTKTVDAEFLLKQKKVFSLFRKVKQVDYSAEYYKYGAEYDIEAHFNDYTDKKAVEEFLYFYRTGFTPKNYVFSIFNDKQRPEAIALYKLFFYAKDFETFYKTAAFAKVHLNEGLFLYTFYIAVEQSQFTQGIVLPSPFEVYPEFFFNKDVIAKIHRVKMQDKAFVQNDHAADFGIFKDNNEFVFYANYSNSLVYGNEETKLSYFTEDIGINTYYYQFYNKMPFWLNPKFNKFSYIKERFGEIYFFKYQQLLNRYYLERLTNGLGEIPTFSWYEPIKTGFNPALYSPFYPFMTRNKYYDMNNEYTYDAVQFMDSYEKAFFKFVQQGWAQTKNGVVDLSDPKSMYFVTDYWFRYPHEHTKPDFSNYMRSYEATARHVLGAAPAPISKTEFVPSTFDFFQTSLRDPMFYQFYKRIAQYSYQAMKLWHPHTKEDLHFVGVKINDVKVDKLTTFFEMYDVDATNAVYYSPEGLKKDNTLFKIRQPRLNHKPFTVTLDIKSNVETDAVFKIFLGPKYDSRGYPISLENNWMNFVQLDWFRYKLTSGANKVERNSGEFFWYKNDGLPSYELQKLFDQGKIPVETTNYFPNRMMLPRGTEGGYPFQLFVVVYPAGESRQEYSEPWKSRIDGRFITYPFDRPVNEANFLQPNIYFKDVEIYHEGEMYPFFYNNPKYVDHHNKVFKH